MNITYYETPPKHMPHMFNKGIMAPVVAAVSFTEAMPEQTETITALRCKPVKPKLFGGGFAKKAEDVFSLFINEPFFNMYQNQAAFDPTGNTVGAIDLPVRSADYALKHLSKRIPYSEHTSDAAPTAQSAAAPISKQTNQADLRQFVDALAHYQSFSMDRTEETKMADELVAGGLESRDAIINYLLSCARGSQKEGWWNNAAQLVRLLGRLPTVDHADDYKMLMRCQSNIWEFQTQVKDVAEQELLKLKKADPAYRNNGNISAEDAQAELKQLDNIYAAEARLKAAIAMKDSVEGWPNDMKAFYYYIIGNALRQQNPKDERQYAFYAAQLFYNPASTSIGWIELRKLDEFKELTPTPENAGMLHEKFPLPTSLDDLIKTL